ncbi:unnamed protein product [Spodoptera littoralis]|uniref:Uncharacterized protein n=1 Tax=Spodoptera littoralis TaxID=7109 RepID=A0A9P0N7I0_SPOLI|nr:unnamed protein product [Spodoptera littoralis]
MDDIDDVHKDKLDEILRMVTQNTQMERTTEVSRVPMKSTEVDATKSMLYKIFNYYLKETRAHRKVTKFTKSTFRKDEISTHKIKKMHLRKIIKKPIIVREVYTTKHKRLHANKLLKESTIVREVETTSHKEDENDEEEETSSLTTPVQVNIKRMPQTTTTMLPYFQMIDDLDEGYMVVFLIELMRIMASKDKDDLFEVLVHTEQIVLQ